MPEVFAVKVVAVPSRLTAALDAVALGRRFFTSLGVAATLTLAFVAPACAEHSHNDRARYGAAEHQQAINVTPLKLEDGSKLTVISPSMWSDISDDLLLELYRTHSEHSSRMGKIPALTTSLRLMDEASFFEYTGAPSWTNAIFFRGQILIPLSTTQPIDLENLRRSVKHEYTHAVISALSGGKAPGWFDEGLAQWAEGSENPALRSALRTYLRSNDPVPLGLLQGGFTKLEESMVPAAYAQSLLATQAMIQYYGFDLLSAYLGMLRAGTDRDIAFETAFRVSPTRFEEKLAASLKAWAASPEGVDGKVVNTAHKRADSHS